MIHKIYFTYQLYSLFLLAGVEQLTEDVNPIQWCKAFECGIHAIKR